ncbi:MAG: ornithine cyclodeaminase family protein [Synergistaceae bacterium]|jgi:ornithine cyclodeaminase/alanine dehydrogenase|nr:ornithine cyclodeaminase family protein [Synergistaceae bacterium]
MYELRILDAVQFNELVSMDDIIPGVEEAYRLYSSGKAGLFPILNREFDPGRIDMDIKAGYLDDADIYGLKIIGWNRDNPALLGVPALAGLIVVMSIERQQPIGLLEASPVTFLRTGAAGAVGAKTLARPASESAVIVGAGSQGRAQLMGLTKVMKNLKRVSIFDMTDNTANKMAMEAASQYPGITVTAGLFAELEEHVRSSDILVTCTPSKQAFIGNGWLKRGAHVNAIGADIPGKGEIDPELLASASVFGDSRSQVSQKGESQHAVALGLIAAESITEIGEVLNGTKRGRMSDDEITLFDATGMALQDLLSAKIAFARAEVRRVGTIVKIEQENL